MDLAGDSDDDFILPKSPKRPRTSNDTPAARYSANCYSNYDRGASHACSYTIVPRLLLMAPPV